MSLRDDREQADFEALRFGRGRVSISQMFWPQVDRRGDDECWSWAGTKDAKGYGFLRPRRAGTRVRMRASQIAWALHNRCPFPADKIACHRCDNPSCVNPGHIWPGTHAENQNDKKVKGRARRDLCRRGLHRMEAGNLIVDKNGGRRCRRCFNDYLNRQRQGGAR